MMGNIDKIAFEPKNQLNDLDVLLNDKTTNIKDILSNVGNIKDQVKTEIGLSSTNKERYSTKEETISRGNGLASATLSLPMKNGEIDTRQTVNVNITYIDPNLDKEYVAGSRSNRLDFFIKELCYQIHARGYDFVAIAMPVEAIKAKKFQWYKVGDEVFDRQVEYIGYRVKQTPLYYALINEKFGNDEYAPRTLVTYSTTRPLGDRTMMNRYFNDPHEFTGRPERNVDKDRKLKDTERYSSVDEYPRYQQLTKKLEDLEDRIYKSVMTQTLNNPNLTNFKGVEVSDRNWDNVMKQSVERFDALLNFNKPLYRDGYKDRIKSYNSIRSEMKSIEKMYNVSKEILEFKSSIEIKGKDAELKILATPISRTIADVRKIIEESKEKAKKAGAKNLIYYTGDDQGLNKTIALLGFSGGCKYQYNKDGERTKRKVEGSDGVIKKGKCYLNVRRFSNFSGERRITEEEVKNFERANFIHIPPYYSLTLKL